MVGVIRSRSSIIALFSSKHNYRGNRYVTAHCSDDASLYRPTAHQESGIRNVLLVTITRITFYILTVIMVHNQ